MSSVDEKQEKQILILQLTRLLGIPGAYVNGTFYRTDVLDRFERPTEWNPLSNDGDALRLARKLKMDIDFDNLTVCTRHYKTGKALCNFAKGEDMQAMRRAIVEAACGYEK